MNFLSSLSAKNDLLSLLCRVRVDTHFPNRHYNKRKYSKNRQVFCRTETFRNSFLPQTVREWNKLDTSIFQVTSYSVFRKALLDFIRPTANSTFGTNDVSGLKLLTRLRVGFSHLREHKFKHNFQDTLNPLCPCSLEAEDTYHFFMRCQSFSNQRNVLFDDLNSINSEILKMSENEIVQVLLFGNKSFSKDMNFRIIISPIDQRHLMNHFLLERNLCDIFLRQE